MVIARLRFSSLLVGLGLLGCSLGCSQEEPAKEPEPELEPLSAEALLIRASLDVRGVRPSAEELARVEKNPAELDALLAEMVDDPRFGERTKSWFAPAFRTRVDEFAFGAYDYYVDEEGADAVFAEAVAEEPLNLVARVALEERPLTDILTSDVTYVDPLLLAVWPLELVSDGPDIDGGLIVARYTDGRPAAGILSTNSFFWRHESTFENSNRGRTNAISRAFLCQDYLDRPIDFPRNIDLTDSESINTAIATNQACQACHSTMDPAASHLWGFMQLAEDPFTWASYHPENELLWQETTMAAPGYFGTPSLGRVDDLAVSIASDERFVTCAVRRVYEGMLGREAALSDEGQLAAHREAFLDGGLSLKTLARSILRDPAYRGEKVLSAYGGRPEALRLKMASPDVLTSSLADLTGYTLRLEGRVATEVDYGLRALSGGSDRADARTPSPGHALVQRRLAEAGARAVVDQLVPASRLGKMLSQVDFESRPEPGVLGAVLRETQGTSSEVDADIQALLSLWDGIAKESGDPADAWTGVLTAILADPRMALY